MKELLLMIASLGIEQAKARLKGVTTADEREVQRLRDFWVAARRATWVTVTDVRNDTSTKCGICGAWECHGCLASCVFSRYPRVGKA